MIFFYSWIISMDMDIGADAHSSLKPELEPLEAEVQNYLQAAQNGFWEPELVFSLRTVSCCYL